MSVLSALKSFFSKLWSGIKKIVPDEQLRIAISLVKVAAEKFVDNEDRRNYVVQALMARFKISESVARLITEIAVRAFKDALD